MIRSEGRETGGFSLYAFVEANAALLFWGFALFHLVFWTLVPALTYGNLPLDVIELVTWGHEWQLGYFKHPPMPSWLLEGATLLFGSAEWPAYLLSQLSIVTAFWVIWRLGREVMGDVAALIAVLLTSLIYFYNFPTPEFNHNVLQIPIWALMGLAAWWAFTGDRLRDWLLLGVLVGLAVYVKYSMAVFVIVLFAFLIVEPSLRRRLLSKGLWLAALLAVIIATPHLVWLVQSDFISLAYASDRSKHLVGVLSRVAGPVEFLLTQLAHHGGLILVLLLGGAFLPFGRGHLTEAVSFRADGRLFRRFILWIALMPVLFTALLSGIAGTAMRPMWATPMFSFTALAVLALAKTAFYKERFRWMAIGWAVLYVGVLIAVASMGLFGSHFTRKPLRMDWPGKEMASHFGQLWQDQTGAHLRFVGGDAWLAGNVSFYAEARPSLVHLDDMAKSPWVSRTDVDCSGVLILWSQKDGGEPTMPTNLAVAQDRITAKGVEPFVWKVQDRPFQIGWAIEAPDAQRCE
ncbi:glycosyltransferase family 39 protein [uncultured Cohaesibacter sp.]|uniref:glycosyltransferase family 39 protein n=1 Tax=uncultured Cohaesibacter sp. TaxID=1002546 RepID=UPI0029C8933E|nr:glycosyltransferase family 39 protein [uncultured Cohaesibacter sp.]